MRTIFERFIAEANSGWWLQSLETYNKKVVPVGEYFIYQKKYGSPLEGGTPPVWSYNLSKLLEIHKRDGGYIFAPNYKILY